MSEQKGYRRIDKAERTAIERGLDARHSARQIARDLGRSASSVSAEVRTNRTVAKGPGKGERASSAPDGACSKLLAWPHACNGCKCRRYRCSRKWRCECSSARAQALSEELLASARRGVNRERCEFEHVVDVVRFDVGRGLSPAQIALSHATEFSVHPATVYRWIEAGYSGMSNIDLLRKAGYKKRKETKEKATPHGPERSYAAFMRVDEEERAGAREMDTASAGEATRNAF